MLRLGFEGLGLHRIVAECDPRNEASIRVMEKLGMRREAHHVEAMFLKGEWVGSMVYAMLEVGVARGARPTDGTRRRRASRRGPPRRSRGALPSCDLQRNRTASEAPKMTTAGRSDGRRVATAPPSCTAVTAMIPTTPAATPSSARRSGRPVDERLEPIAEQQGERERRQEDAQRHRERAGQPAGDEADERREDDQRRGQDAAEGEAIEELGVGQPAAAHGVVAHERDRRVRAAERQQAGLQPAPEKGDCVRR